jgi:hypothetical protein
MNIIYKGKIYSIDDDNNLIINDDGVLVDDGYTVHSIETYPSTDIN